MLTTCKILNGNTKQGFTLIELMVYIALLGGIVLIAGQAFSDSTKMRIRTDNMIRANQEAENTAMIIKEDIEQLGSKTSKESSGSSNDVFFTASNRIYMDPTNTDDNKKDSSSFLIQKDEDTDFSILTFKKVRYDEDGLGHYKAIDSIRWFVEEDTLKRSCWIIEAVSGFTLPDGDPCVNGTTESNPVSMVGGVTVFNIEAASPGAKEDLTQVFPLDGSDEFILLPRKDGGKENNRGFVSFKSANGGNEELSAGNSNTLSGFWSNYQNQEDNIDNAVLSTDEQKINQAIAIGDAEVENFDWKTLCLDYGKMSFKPNTVYEISFNVVSQISGDRSASFVPGKDHMSVGFRRASSGDFAKSKTNPNKIILPDFFFYPPLDNNKGDGAGKRTMRFSVPEQVDNVCLAFTFAFYSPVASLGHVTIRDLKISQVASANYKFDGFEPETGNNKKEKKNVKALKLKLQVARGVKYGGAGETGNVDLIIPIPSNGTGD